MIKYLKADFLKQKHRSTVKLLWIAPLVPISLSIILMGGLFFVEGSFNWWYTFILPSTMAMIVAFNVAWEKKYNRHGLFSVCVDKKKLWVSGILSNTISLLILNCVFFLFLSSLALFFGIKISLITIFIACVTLFLTLAWQIPLLMFSSETIGGFVTIFMGLICNMGFGVFVAPTKLWFVPFAIPSRLMCPIVGVMPNGLPVQPNSPLEDTSVIFLGVFITIALYIVFSLLTTLWFDRSEVKS